MVLLRIFAERTPSYKVNDTVVSTQIYPVSSRRESYHDGVQGETLSQQFFLLDGYNHSKAALLMSKNGNSGAS